jgi:hypothetical protein
MMFATGQSARLELGHLRRILALFPNVADSSENAKS